MNIKKSNLTLSCQTLLPILSTDENFEYFAPKKEHRSFFSSLISTTDFCRVMSLMQYLSLKKQPISCIFHLRQKTKPSMLVLMNGRYEEGVLKVTIYDLATLDDTTLKDLTYHKLNQVVNQHV